MMADLLMAVVTKMDYRPLKVWRLIEAIFNPIGCTLFPTRAEG